MKPSRPLVIVTRTLPADWLEPLADHAEILMGPAEAARDGELAPQLGSELHRAAGLLTLLTERVDAAVLSRAPKLRVVSNMAVGVDNIDLQACADRGIAVGHTPGVLTDATADLTWALVLAVARNVVAAGRDAAAGNWGPWSPSGWLGLELRGRTLGIVGLGAIGTAVARRAEGFGMTVRYTSRSPRAQVPSHWTRMELGQLLADSDVISLHVPLTAQTHHLIDEPALARMKPGAILINTSRGAVVDQSALLSAASAGHIRVGLDVTDPEPLAPGHPLFSLRNVVITPHIGSATERTRRAMALLAAQNALLGIQGLALAHTASL